MEDLRNFAIRAMIIGAIVFALILSFYLTPLALIVFLLFYFDSGPNPLGMFVEHISFGHQKLFAIVVFSFLISWILSYVSPLKGGLGGRLENTVVTAFAAAVMACILLFVVAGTLLNAPQEIWAL